MRLPRATPQRPRLATVAALLAEPAHDLEWLRNALQVAIQLELATLPPYLTARWTIKSGADPVARSIYDIRQEEMFHFGLACNLLAADRRSAPPRRRRGRPEVSGRPSRGASARGWSCRYGS